MQPRETPIRRSVSLRAFELLEDRAGVELCDACSRTIIRCDSIREALYRLRKKGVVDKVKTCGVSLWFLLRDAQPPIDRRGIRRS